MHLHRAPRSPAAVTLLTALLIAATLPAVAPTALGAHIVGDLEARPPLVIQGNADLAAQAAANGWPGNGTPGNPYVIEGYAFQPGNASTGNVTVRIDDTTAHVTLRHCRVPAGGDGRVGAVRLSNAINVRLENNTVPGGAWAVYMRGVRDVTIHGNNLTANGYTVLLHGWSERVLLSNNTLTGGQRAVDVTAFSDDNTLRGNIIRGAAAGVHAEFAGDIHVANNTFDDNGVGVLVGIATDTTRITGNAFTGNGAGVAIDTLGPHTIRAIIAENRFEDNGVAVRAEEAKRYHILDNTILGGSTGLALTAPHDARVEGNSFNGQAGIAVAIRPGYMFWPPPLAAVVAGNTIKDAEAGVHVRGDGPVRAEDNLLSNLTRAIVLAGEGHNVTGNTVEASGVALRIHTPSPVPDESEGNHVARNTLVANTVGISLEDVRNHRFVANHITGGDVGVLFGVKVEANEFTRNHLEGNEVGVQMDNGYDNLFYDNAFQNEANARGIALHRNAWSVDAAPGPNIAGGPLIGGNLWSDYAGTDSDGDGFGDAPHLLVLTGTTAPVGAPVGGGALPADHRPLVTAS